MKITERKLRRIIRSVIREAMGDDHSMSADDIRSGIPRRDDVEYADQLTRDHLGDDYLDLDDDRPEIGGVDPHDPEGLFSMGDEGVEVIPADGYDEY